MNITKNEKRPQGSALKSPWVWAAFALLVIVFTVNYAFFSVALNTTSGLVNEEYYKYGLQQNKIDKQYRKQALRGWEIELNMPKQWDVNRGNLVTLAVHDKSGNPISHGTAELTAYRPSNAKEDVTQQLVETAEQGIYQAEISLHLQGVWDMNLLFTSGEDKYMLNQRITIQGEGDSQSSTLQKIVDFILP